MSAVQRLKPELPARPEIRVPPGIYQLRYKYHATLEWRRWRGKGEPVPKIVLGFEIAGGEHAGLPLHKYYRVRSVEGPDILNGAFAPLPSRRSKLVSDLLRLNRWSTNEVSLDCLRGRTLEAAICTVEQGFRDGGRKHERLREWEQYSTVQRLIRIIGGRNEHL